MDRIDACVFTGPSYALARLLPEGQAWRDYARELKSIEYLGAVCLVFTSDQVVGEQYWLNVNEPGAPFLVFLRHTRLVDASRYASKQVYYIGAYVPQESRLLSRDADDIASAWWTYLKTIYPAFDQERVLEKHVFKFRGAQHIVDTSYESRIPAYRTPLPGVFLANFSQVFPEDRGTNYAVREGKKIADLVVADLRSGPKTLIKSMSIKASSKQVAHGAAVAIAVAAAVIAISQQSFWIDEANSVQKAIQPSLAQWWQTMEVEGGSEFADAAVHAHALGVGKTRRPPRVGIARDEFALVSAGRLLLCRCQARALVGRFGERFRLVLPG